MNNRPAMKHMVYWRTKLVLLMQHTWLL